MARSYHLNLDAEDQTKALLRNGFNDDQTADPPTFFRSDTFPANFIFFRRSSSSAINGKPFINVPPPATLKVSMGELYATPIGGTFTISSAGMAETTAPIAYNASAAVVQAAVRLALITDFANATVTGPDGGPWLITAVGAGILSDITVDPDALSPAGSTVVVDNTEGDIDHDEQWEVTLFRRPAMFRSTGWAAMPSAAVSADIVQAGSATANKSYEISWNQDTYAGSVILSVLAGADTRTVGPIAFNATADEVLASFVAHSGITSADNVGVKQTDVGKYEVTFKGTLANSNSPTISTSSNTLQVPVGLTATLAVSTAGANAILQGEPEAQVCFEVEIRENVGEPETVFQILDAKLRATSIPNNPGVNTENEDFALLHDVLWTDDAIIGYIGGDADDFDSIPTVDRSVGQFFAFNHATDGLRVYELLSSTAAESSPTVIRPDDYHGTTNPKVWFLIGHNADNVTTGTLGLARGGTGATTAFSAFQSIRPFAMFTMEEEFTGYSVDENILGNGWRSFDAVGVGSFTFGTASGSSWGLLSITTGATSGNGRHLGLGTLSSNAALDDLSTIVPWEAWFRFSISATTSILTLVGFLSNPFGIETTCDQISLRFDTAADTTFKVLCRASGTSSVTDTTVTPSASTFYSLRIWSDTAGTIKFRVHSAAGAVLGNEVTISTNVPGTVMTPDFFVRTLTASARTLTADTFRIQATLAR